MEYKFAELTKRMGGEGAFEVLAQAKAIEATGKKVVHFEIGEPDFDTPPHIKKAAYEALEQGYTHYGPAPGLPEVRTVFANYVARTRNTKVDPEQIVITVGAKPIILYSMFAFVEPGDEVIYPDPGYPIYASAVQFVGGIPKPIILREENEFRLDVDELKKLITPKTKLIIINTPHNPTGSVLTREDIKNILEIVDGTNIMIVADELYHRIYFEGEMAPSFYEFEEFHKNIILMEGFSKIYAMTGWRLGYAVVPRPVANIFSQIQVNVYSHAPTFIQLAGKAAYEGPQDEPKAMVEEFKRRRDYIIERLNNMPGVSALLPHGAFYAFPNVKKINRPADEIAEYLLEHGGVALLAGTSFGSGGEGYLRISYATSMDDIKIGMDRMEEAFSKLLKEE